MTDKIKVKLYIHLEQYSIDDEGRYSITSCDMSENGYILLGTQEVEIDAPDKDPIVAELEMLDKHLEAVEQESYNKITAIKQRIQSLQAIEYKG